MKSPSPRQVPKSQGISSEGFFCPHWSLWVTSSGLQHCNKNEFRGVGFFLETPAPFLASLPKQTKIWNHG